MTIESDTLDVLKALKKQFEKSSQSFSSGGGTRGAQQGDRIKAEREKKYQDSITKAKVQLGYFRDTAESSRKPLKEFKTNVGQSAKGLGTLAGKVGATVTAFEAQKRVVTGLTSALGGSLGNLNKNVGLSVTGLGTLQTRLAGFDVSPQLTDLQNAVTAASSALSATRPVTINTADVDRAIGKFENILSKRVNPGLNSLNIQSGAVAGAFAGLITSLGTQATRSIGSIRLARQFLVLSNTIAGRNGNTGLIQQLGRATKFVRAFATSLAGGRGSGGGGVARRGGGGNPASASNSSRSNDADPKSISESIKNVISKPSNIIKAIGVTAAGTVGHNLLKIFDDTFQRIAARGFGVGAQTMTEFYTNAAMAGMALEDYVKVIDSNMGVFTRFKNLEEFDAELAHGRDGLRAYGIAGLEATDLTAQFMSTASSLGVPMENMRSSVNNQIAMFARLQKATGVTAEAFKEISAELMNNEIVQKEMLGLNAQEREARMAQLVQTQTWGKSLGLTEQAARKLTDALLGTRKSTVKERFQAAGRVRQAFAIAGMSAEDQQRGAELYLNRNRSDDEDKELAGLQGDYKQRAEGIKASGNIGLANQMEIADSNLDQTIAGPLNEAVVQLKLMEESGKQRTEMFKGALGRVEQEFIRFSDVIEGVAKNPAILVGIGIASASLAIIAGAIWQSTLATNIASKITMAFKAAGIGGNGGPGVPPTPNSKFGKMRLGAGLRGGALAGGISAVMAGMDYSNAEETAKERDVSKTQVQGEAIGKGLGSVIFGTLGGLLGSFLGPLGTLAGASIGAIAGDYIGTWVGESFGKFFESSDEKKARAAREQKAAIEKNTAQTDKNTKELNSVAKQLPSAVISRDNLGILGSNAITTATGLAARAHAVQGPIATPTPQAVTGVNSSSVNTAEGTETAQQKASVAAAAAAALPPQEQNSVLAKMLLVLEQSLTEEKSQVEMLQRMIAANSPASRLPSNKAMNDIVRLA